MQLQATKDVHFHFCLNSEKTSGTRTRRCTYFLFICFMMGTLFFFYNANDQVSWSFGTWSSSSWQSGSDTNMTTVSNDFHRPVDSEYLVTYPHKYRFLLDEPDRCRQESPFLVLMIPVAPHNKEARDAIRKTWGKETLVLGQVVSHYFLLGWTKKQDSSDPLAQEILQESHQHHDLLQSDFLDCYKNLTIKTMVMFEWLSTHCPNTSYGMKIDSDMFLNVHNLVHMLLEAPQHLYMTGMVVKGAHVIRDNTSKWYMPHSAFSEPSYPPYAMGLGYVFSLDLPKKIVEASVHVEAVYIEDVYVGLCLRHLGIALTDPPSSYLFRASMPNSVSNCYWTIVITTILDSAGQLLDTWEKYQTAAQSC